MNVSEAKQTSLTLEPARPTRVRVPIVAILFITMLIAFLDRVNVSVIIADPASRSEMNIMTDPTAQGLLMSFLSVRLRSRKWFLVRSATGSVPGRPVLFDLLLGRSPS